jgi:hypothetical protein
MDNGNEDRRHFIVAKEGRDVIVREVPKGSCAHTYTKAQAWKHAKRLREYGNEKKRIEAGRLIVVGLDNMRIVTEWPAEVVEEALDIQAESVHTTPMTNTTTKQPTEAQVNLFNKLCTELVRVNNQDADAYTAGFASTVDRAGASKAIEAAITAVKDAKRVANMPHSQAGAPVAPSTEVPAGRYAIENDEGTLGFFQVDRPTEGRWAGYTFVKYQASDETYPVRDKAKRERILSKIAQDVKSAMLTYGREIGACGHCGRTLTDEDSRNAGIGPVCAGKVSWA